MSPKQKLSMLAIGAALIGAGELGAMVPTKEWDKRFGGTLSDTCWAIQQTSDGGYILAGSSTSGLGGDKTEDSRGNHDFWIVKINSAGVTEWDKRFGGAGEEYCSAILQTSDGGYVVAGDSASGIGGDKTEPSRGGYDFWVVKINSAGSKEWDKRFGGSDYDAGCAINPTCDGGYILAGESDSGAGGDKTEDSRGDTDYWIVKINSAGVKEWDKRFGGAEFDGCYSIQQTSDGGYAAGGYSLSGAEGDKTEDSRGGSDYWIVKINSNGAKEWDKRFGGSKDDYACAAQQTMDNGYLAGGYSYSGAGGDKTEESWGSSDYWIVKINSNGVKEWDKRFGGLAGDYCESIKQTSDGSCIAAGYGNSGVGGDKTEGSRGGFDYWIVKMLAPPVITGQPQSLTRDTGAAASFTVTATGSAPLFYQWQKDAANISQATGTIYAIASVTSADAGGYRCVVSNAAGISTSATATLTVAQVTPPPDVPASVSASDGAFTDKVRVTWAAAPRAASYQVWRHTSDDSGAAVQLASGIADTSYNDTGAAADMTYFYWVSAVNAAGASAFSEADTGYLGVVGPLVSVNGMAGDNISVPSDAPIVIAAEMMNLPPAYLGYNVDWWLAAYAHTGNLWYYLNSDMIFMPFDGNPDNCRPAYQGPLYNVPQQIVASGLTLAPGAYNIWFAVDYPMDGILRLDGQSMLSQATLIVIE